MALISKEEMNVSGKSLAGAFRTLQEKMSFINVNARPWRILEFDMIGLDITFPKRSVAPGVQSNVQYESDCTKPCRPNRFKP